VLLEKKGKGGVLLGGEGFAVPHRKRQQGKRPLRRSYLMEKMEGEGAKSALSLTVEGRGGKKERGKIFTLKDAYADKRKNQGACFF